MCWFATNENIVDCGKIAACLSWALGKNTSPKRKPLCAVCAERKVKAKEVEPYTYEDYVGDEDTSIEDQEYHAKVWQQQFALVQALAEVDSGFVV